MEEQNEVTTPAESPNGKPKALADAANALATECDSDVFFYNSPISRPFDDEIIATCSRRRRRPNITLLLVTGGGDPDAAYRIARCFQEHYEKFTCIVAGYCKSSGTLMVTGATQLVMCEAAELGPLDVQMSKKDELFESESGLTVVTAMDALREKCFSSFEHFALTLKKKSGNRITFKTAAELAIKMTVGQFTPIYQHIDPMHVGEASRSQAIGQHYGLRLSFYGGNISGESLQTLISGYPSHGFVIDRQEAKDLFESVREPNAPERHLISVLGRMALDPVDNGEEARLFLSSERPEKGKADDATENAKGSLAARARHKRVVAPPREGPEQEDIHQGSAPIPQ